MAMKKNDRKYIANRQEKRKNDTPKESASNTKQKNEVSAYTDIYQSKV
jgi:hypothetical protein